ncbi:hypothetical protein EVAR_24423_1 [Eumeta japonica]|uniref:Uncharacterized protein n=1 Tax=Eumeta variegata TaxID=151549 RepID=A0A4C1VUH4_EUMVA|nr:hypothetical protein EVAR_24423_1 [Eumeta japonica]
MKVRMGNYKTSIAVKQILVLKAVALLLWLYAKNRSPLCRSNGRFKILTSPGPPRFSRPSYVPQYQIAYALAPLRNSGVSASGHSYLAQTLARPASSSFSAVPQAYFGSPLAFATNDRGSVVKDDPVYG